MGQVHTFKLDFLLILFPLTLRLIILNFTIGNVKINRPYATIELPRADAAIVLEMLRAGMRKIDRVVRKLVHGADRNV